MASGAAPFVMGSEMVEPLLPTKASESLKLTPFYEAFPLDFAFPSGVMGVDGTALGPLTMVSRAWEESRKAILGSV